MTDPATIPEDEAQPTLRAALLDLEAEIVRLQHGAETLRHLAALLGEEAVVGAQAGGGRQIPHASALLAEAHSLIDTARRCEERFALAWGQTAGPRAGKPETS